jgi:hypothetical protein
MDFCNCTLGSNHEQWSSGEGSVGNPNGRHSDG